MRINYVAHTISEFVLILAKSSDVHLPLSTHILVWLELPLRHIVCVYDLLRCIVSEYNVLLKIDSKQYA